MRGGPLRRWHRIVSAYKKRGLSKFLVAAVEHVLVLYVIPRTRNLFLEWYYRITRGPRSFTFRGQRFEYLIHRRNATWDNERAVEIPIVRKFLEEAGGKRILEFGNTLSQYVRFHGDVLDKTEAAPGVINEDVVSFRSPRRYDLVLGVSTLEHVGLDYGEDRDPSRVLKAFENLKGHLAPGGIMVLTLPVGYNPAVDEYLEDGRLGFTERYFLKRMSADNEWTEVARDVAKDAQYGRPFPYANAIAVGVYRKG